MGNCDVRTERSSGVMRSMTRLLSIERVTPTQDAPGGRWELRGKAEEGELLDLEDGNDADVEVAIEGGRGLDDGDDVDLHRERLQRDVRGNGRQQLDALRDFELHIAGDALQ